MKARLWLIAVIVLLLAAVVFAVAMTGHTFVAALCAFIALVIVFSTLQSVAGCALPQLWCL